MAPQRVEADLAADCVRLDAIVVVLIPPERAGRHAFTLHRLAGLDEGWSE
jgi:hypothetical protein